jgi:hypothetical protein
MYTKAVVWATSATPLPMWDPEGSGMVPVPNMVADFRDSVPGHIVAAGGCGVSDKGFYTEIGAGEVSR